MIYICICVYIRIYVYMYIYMYMKPFFCKKSKCLTHPHISKLVTCLHQIGQILLHFFYTLNTFCFGKAFHDQKENHSCLVMFSKIGRFFWLILKAATVGQVHTLESPLWLVWVSVCFHRKIRLTSAMKLRVGMGFFKCFFLIICCSLCSIKSTTN